MFLKIFYDQYYDYYVLLTSSSLVVTMRLPGNQQRLTESYNKPSLQIDYRLNYSEEAFQIGTAKEQSTLAAKLNVH